MHGRRITRALGAVAGGLLGAAFLPAAAAFADDYDVSPTGTETVTGLYGYGIDGEDGAPPGMPGSVQGDQTFDYTDTTTGHTGEFYGLESTSTTSSGDVNTEIYVASDVSGKDAPAVGSVFDTDTFGGGPDANAYSDIYSPSGDTITDTLESPSGDSSIPITFDAADFPVADAGGVPVGDGDDLDPVSGTQSLDAISGIPPLFIALQGTQIFDLNNNLGAAFDADETTSSDIGSTYTEAALVTRDLSGTVGTAVGDTPAVGSIFNTMNLGGYESVYSDLTSSSGNVITDTIETPSGDFTIPETFDAALAETTSAISIPDGDQLSPVGSLDFTGINGLPPLDVAVQGTQEFEVDGSNSGAFDADVTNTLDMFGDSSETVLVTKDLGADAPPVGSVFETVTFGDSGVENIYSDIASTTAGGDVISDTLVTPLGDTVIPSTMDTSAALVNDLFSGI
jgi:hypothetical protein